jgi:hypothetical protein
VGEWVIYKQRAHLSQKGTPWRETERFRQNCKAKNILLMVMVQKRIMFNVWAKRGQATNSHSLAERVSFLLLDKDLSLQLTLCYLLMLEVDEPLCSCGGKS